MHIVNLKQCTESLPTLAQWHQAEWSYLNPGQSLKDRIDKMQAYLNADFIPSTYVAKENNKVLGSAAIIECDMEERKELSPWLASVYVVPDFRCKGIGAALVKYVMQQAAENNFKTLYLYTPDQQQFYKKLGWKTKESLNYHGHDVAIMAVTLV